MEQGLAFHLTRGGPLYRLMVPAKLLPKDIPSASRAIISLVLLTWVPLLILSLVQGVLLGDSVQVPFLVAISPHVRYLLAVPLFILAEPFVDKRLALASAHFVRSDLLKQEDLPRFKQAVRLAEKARDAFLPELILFVLALSGMALGHQLELPRSVSTWQLLTDQGGTHLTLAGWWNGAVSSTIFRFLIFRWLWRLFIWTVFLRRVSRLRFRLYPTHPDRAGGLGFLSVAQTSLGILVFAGGCVLSANFAQTVFFLGEAPTSFISIIILYVLIGMILLVGPLLVFTPKLFAVKFDAMHDYLLMSTEYNRLFHRRWIADKAYENEAILGTEDIQSLAALDGTIGMIRDMRPIPINLRFLIFAVVIAVLPMVPLIGFEISLDEIVLGFLESFF